MTHKATKLMKILDNHYEKIKHRSGINELLKGEPPDIDSTNAFAKLRPTSPYTLQQLLDPKMETYRAKRWLFHGARPKQQMSLTRPAPRSVGTPMAQTLGSTWRSTTSQGWTHRKTLKISPQKSKNSLPKYVTCCYEICYFRFNHVGRCLKKTKP